MDNLKVAALVGDSYAILSDDIRVQENLKAVLCIGVPGIPIVDKQTPEILSHGAELKACLWSPCTEMQGWRRADEILKLAALPPAQRLLEFEGADRYAPRLFDLSNLTEAQHQEWIDRRSQLLNIFLEQLDHYLSLYPSIRLFPLALRWYGARLPKWLRVRDAWGEVQSKFGDRCVDLDELLDDPGNFQDEQGHLSYAGWEFVRLSIINSLK